MKQSTYPGGGGGGGGVGWGGGGGGWGGGGGGEYSDWLREEASGRLL